MAVPPARSSSAHATLGAVLAGGLARRMGGGDKPLLALGSRPLLTHVLDRLAPQCASCVINANGDPARFASWPHPVVPDGLPGHPGPLAGILAVLDWTQACRPSLEWVVTVPGDTPFIPQDLVARLHAERDRSGARVACAASGGRLHPAVGLWPVALRDGLREAMRLEGSGSVRAWAQSVGMAHAAWPSEPVDPFLNVNDLADLERAEQLLETFGNASQEAAGDDRT